MAKISKPLWERITRPRKGGGRVLIRPLRASDICRDTVLDHDTGRSCALGWALALDRGAVSSFVDKEGKAERALGDATKPCVVSWNNNRHTPLHVIARTCNRVFRKLGLIRPAKKARGR